MRAGAIGDSWETTGRERVRGLQGSPRARSLRARVSPPTDASVAAAADDHVVCQEAGRELVRFLGFLFSEVTHVTSLDADNHKLIRCRWELPMPMRRRLVVAGVVAAAITAAPVVPVAADPQLPSQNEVDDARRAEESAAAAVTAIEEQLVAVAARLDDVQIAAARAVEAHNGAVLALTEAEQAEQAASAEAVFAASEADGAHVELGRLAAASYRNGGQLTHLAFIPGIAIRISECHGNIDNHAEARLISFRFD